MSNYQKYWDRYVKELFPKAANRDEIRWPGDEWGAEQRWRRLFDSLFKPANVQDWRMVLEIGQGSGKYTKLVLDAAPQCVVAAFDVSGEFLNVCGERLAAEKAAGRLHLELLRCERSDEMVLALERLDMVGKLDAFFSMDAMVHVDLQYLMAYLLTASVALKKGGYLVMTLADATTDRGFDFLVSRIARFYGQQGLPVGKFEWMSSDIARSVLGRLGFEIVKCETPPRGAGRDIHLIAQLADPAKGRELSWALCDEPKEQRKADRHAPGEQPVLRWSPVESATEYYAQFSANKFGSLVELKEPLSVAPSEDLMLPVPASLWQSFPKGRPLHWRVMAECPDRKRVANRGILLKVDESDLRRPRPAKRAAAHDQDH